MNLKINNRLVWISIIVLLMLYACEPSSQKELLLTSHSWTINKVENISKGQFGPRELNKGTVWNFRIDNTFRFEMKNDYYRNKSDSGTWVLNEGTIIIYSEKDTVELIIENLSKTEMTCLAIESDSIRFYLKTQE